MGAVFSALKADTINGLQLDAGVILTNLSESEIEAFDNSKIAAKIKSKDCLGATKGGAQFSAVPEVRSLFDGVDGARGAYKQGEIIDSWEITLKTTITELTAKNIERVVNATQTAKGSSYKAVVGEVGMINNKHFKNIAWVGNCAGGDKPMIIYLKDVINTNGVNFTAEDKNTGTIEVEFKAHFDLAKPDEVPFAIYTAIAG